MIRWAKLNSFGIVNAAVANNEEPRGAGSRADFIKLSRLSSRPLARRRDD
jgi:hypothetical protein